MWTKLMEWSPARPRCTDLMNSMSSLKRPIVRSFLWAAWKRYKFPGLNSANKSPHRDQWARFRVQCPVLDDPVPNSPQTSKSSDLFHSWAFWTHILMVVNRGVTLPRSLHYAAGAHKPSARKNRRAPVGMTKTKGPASSLQATPAKACVTSVHHFFDHFGYVGGDGGGGG